MVKEKNWLEVYPYTSWGGNANLPVLEEGQTFTPSSIMLREVCYMQPMRQCCVDNCTTHRHIGKDSSRTICATVVAWMKMCAFVMAITLLHMYQESKSCSPRTTFAHSQARAWH